MGKEGVELVVYVHFPVLKGETNGFGNKFATGVVTEVTRFEFVFF